MRSRSSPSGSVGGPLLLAVWASGKHAIMIVKQDCGAGAKVIALSQAMREAGINYRQHLNVTAVDIDPRGDGRSDS